MLKNEKYSINKTKSDIILVGEILSDFIIDEKTAYTTQSFGGSAANVTSNIKSLGFNPIFFGAVGNDDLGNSLKNDLLNRNIDVTYLSTVNFPTTIVKINKATHSPIPFFQRSADYHIKWSSLMEEKLKNTNIFHFTYWPLSHEPSRSTILEAIDVAKQNNVLIGFDPNYHKDIDISNGEDFQFIKEILKDIDIIKPSLDDSIRLFGDGYSNLEYIKNFHNYGCKLVIMTLGKDGLIASMNGETVFLKSLATKVVDSTGAGDAFWGGLYAGILSHETILNAIRIGLLCSAYNVQNVGARCVFPSFQSIKKILEARS